MSDANVAGNGNGLRRWTDRILIGMAGVVIALIAALWSLTNARIDETNKRLDRMEQKMDQKMDRILENTK